MEHITQKKKMLQCLDFQRVDISRASERANTQLRTIEVQFVNSEPVYDKQKKGLRDKNEKQEKIFLPFTCIYSLQTRI